MIVFTRRHFLELFQNEILIRKLFRQSHNAFDDSWSHKNIENSITKLKMTNKTIVIVQKQMLDSLIELNVSLTRLDEDN